MTQKYFEENLKQRELTLPYEVLVQRYHYLAHEETPVGGIRTARITSEYIKGEDKPEEWYDLKNLGTFTDMYIWVENDEHYKERVK